MPLFESCKFTLPGTRKAWPLHANYPATTMNITITESSEDYQKKLDLLWSLTASGWQRKLLVMTSIGMLLLLVGFLSPASTVEVNGRVINYTLNINLGIGIGMLLVAVLQYFGVLRIRRGYFSNAREFLDRATEHGTSVRTIVLTDTEIIVSSFEETSRLLWSKFRYYKATEAAIVLYQHREQPSSVVIFKAELNDEQLRDFAKVLAGKARL